MFDLCKNKAHELAGPLAASLLVHLCLTAPATAQEDVGENDTEASPVGIETDSGEQEVIDKIVVTGFRASLSAGLREKRESISLVDAIFAEDVAKFPDLNISEALQRIPGVTISRGPSGEGNEVSVRGLAPEFTRVTFNGITAATGNLGRQFDFDVFASELFSQITLTKTPSAELTEGGLAGTIDLRSPRPLDFDEPTFLFSGGGQYAELGRGNVTPRFSGLASYRTDDGKFGILLSASYSESSIRGDTSDGFRWETLAFRTQLDELVNAAVANGTPVPTVNIDGVDVNDPDALLEIANRVNVSILPRNQIWLLDRDRLGITGSIQFNPSDSVSLAVDILYAEMDENEDRHTVTGTPGFSGRIVVPTALTLNGDYAIAASFDPVNQSVNDVNDYATTDFLHVTPEATFLLTDSLTLRLSGGYSEASEEFVRRFYDYIFTGGFSYDFSDPKFAVFAGDGLDYFDTTARRGGLLQFLDQRIEDREYGGRADLVWAFDRSGLAALKGGVEYRDRQKSNELFRIVEIGGPASFSEVAADGLPVDNFLKGAPANAITAWAPLDFDKAKDLVFPDSLLPQLFDSPLLSSFWTVTERAVAGYLQSDWEFDVGASFVTANLGVRIVNTDQTSDGFLFAGGIFSPIQVARDYTDVLPSANVRWNVTDEFVVRATANRALTRPTLSQLSPGTTASGTSLNGTAGNPELEPFRANQVDLSFEWYFEPESLISVTGFFKDVESFIVTAIVDRVVVGPGLFDGAGNDVSGSVFAIRTPINGIGGHVYGLEVQYQQPFTFLPEPFDGFGLLANVTLADSEGTLELGGQVFKERLQGQSNISFNTILYYEKGPFSARAAFAHRGDFISQYRGVRANGDLWTFTVDDRNQLDLAFRYSVFEKVELFLDIINVTGEGQYTYDTLPFLNSSNTLQGVTYNFGVRVAL